MILEHRLFCKMISKYKPALPVRLTRGLELFALGEFDRFLRHEAKKYMRPKRWGKQNKRSFVKFSHSALRTSPEGGLLDRKIKELRAK